jgi:prepilin-type N-terminal cleavage/methylation domain-containing protein
MRDPKRRAGFTLIEVLVATSLLSMGLGTAAFLMASAYGTYRSQNKTLEINHVVHDQMEKLSSTTYENLATDMRMARNPGDPFRDALPPERDYEKGVSRNGVIARYELIPPPPESDAYTVRRKTGMIDEYLVGSGSKPNNVDVTMILEYWDPQFDAPTNLDKGLIRAEYAIEWGGTHDRGVKYLAR